MQRNGRDYYVCNPDPSVECMHPSVVCAYMSFIRGTLIHGRELCSVMVEIIMFVIPIDPWEPASIQRATWW